MLITLIALQAAVSECVIPADRESAQLAMSYEAFDGTPPPYGWRALNAAGCADAAVQLLERYLVQNRESLSPAQRREMHFHMGQVLAFAGRNEEAVTHVARADGHDASPEWRAYVAATLAFLRRDGAALTRARDLYARIAPNSMRLRMIEGFLACLDRNYTEAAHCRM